MQRVRLGNYGDRPAQRFAVSIRVRSSDAHSDLPDQMYASRIAYRLRSFRASRPDISDAIVGRTSVGHAANRKSGQMSINK